MMTSITAAELKTSPQMSTEPTAELQKRISRRAFELYEERGREDGHDIGDWLQAKSECSKR